MNIKDIAAALRNDKPYEAEIIYAKLHSNELTAFERDLFTALQNRKPITLRKLALAEHRKTTSVTGYIKATASVNNPFHTELEVLITPLDTANKNKQGIRKAEAQNIINTALGSPLKVNFDGIDIQGHIGANAIGAITAVQDKIDRIIGKAVIWDDLHEGIAAYIKEQVTVGTSWEIYYDESLSTKDNNGITWLTDCIFAGLCVVSNPAYGSEAFAKVV